MRGETVGQTVKSYIYVFQCDNDVLKIGRTGNPGRRHSVHRRIASQYGVSIVDHWHSERLDHPEVWEKKLRDVCNVMGEQAGSRESFRGIPFTVARCQAENLEYATPCPTCGRRLCAALR